MAVLVEAGGSGKPVASPGSTSRRRGSTMNDIMKRPRGGAPAPAQRRRFDVKALMRHHVGPLKAVEVEVRRVDSLMCMDGFRFLANRNFYDELYSIEVLQAGGAEAARIRKDAVAIWPQLPSPEWLAKALDFTTKVLTEPVDEPKMSLLLGAMFDGLRVKVDDRSAVLAGAMSYMLEDGEETISAVTLSAAIKRLWKTVEYATISIAEVVNTCLEVRRKIYALQCDVNGIWNYRDGIEEILRFTGDLPPPRNALNDDFDW
jgi:hypothetical protein